MTDHPSPKGESDAGHPNDLCYCGDYRHQHANDGAGACRLNGLGHPGGSPCQRFRFSRAALQQGERS